MTPAPVPPDGEPQAPAPETMFPPDNATVCTRCGDEFTDHPGMPHVCGGCMIGTGNQDAYDAGFAAGRAAATPDPPDDTTPGRRNVGGAPASDTPTSDGGKGVDTGATKLLREWLDQCAAMGAGPLAQLTQATLDFLAAGRAAATPDPAETDTRGGGDASSVPDQSPAASPDERLREALARANEDLILIADEASEDVGEAIDSVRAAIKDALAAADREAPDRADNFSVGTVGFPPVSDEPKETTT